jgi:protein-tyrosine-phosphatase
MNIVVVCTGNTCRSPLAAVLLKSLRPSWNIRSAGVSAGNGRPASRNSASVAKELGLSLADHSSQDLSPELVHWADLVLCVSQTHANLVKSRYPDSKSKIDHLPDDIDDPFGQSLDCYRQTAKQLQITLQLWLDSSIKGTQQKIASQ